MAETLKGKGVRWGAQTTLGTGIVVAAPGVAYTQSGDFSITPNKQDFLNQYGQKIGHAYVDYEKTMTITVLPTATGATAIADVKKAFADLLPLPGDPLVLGNDSTAWIDTGTNAEWVVMGARVRETNTGPVLIEIDVMGHSEFTGATPWADIAAS